MTVFHHCIELTFHSTDITNRHSTQALRQVYLSSASETVQAPLTLTACNSSLAAVARIPGHSI